MEKLYCVLKVEKDKKSKFEGFIPCFKTYAEAEIAAEDGKFSIFHIEDKDAKI